MLNRLRQAACGAIILAGALGHVFGGPPTAEEVARQNAALDNLAATVAAAQDDAAKLAAFEAAARDASVEVRRRALDLAASKLTRDREAFF